MGRKLTQEDFIERVSKIHNNKYCYNKTKYINLRTEITIICPIHSEFTQVANSHIQGSGCQKCGIDRITKTTEEFIEKAKEKHGDKYDYSLVEYEGKGEKVIIICRTHGSFQQEANSHLRGANCSKCSYITGAKTNTKTTKEFIEEASIKHNNKYLYTNTNYIGAINKLGIICKEHGVFRQTASNHLRGTGCPLCVKQNTLSWSRSNYIKKADGRICTFYTLRCFNKDEEFYKIGITMNLIKYRYSGKDNMPYEYEVISEVKGSAGFIWDLEISEKRKLKDFKYQPKIDFKGSKTECFTKYELLNGKK